MQILKQVGNCRSPNRTIHHYLEKGFPLPKDVQAVPERGKSGTQVLRFHNIIESGIGGE